MKITKKLFYILILLGCIILLYVFLTLLNSSFKNKNIKQSLQQQLQQGRSLLKKNNVMVGGQTNETNQTQNTFYKVVHVADGDTIDIKKDGQKVRLRLLGINSPESVAENRPDECYGKEASDYIKNLVNGKDVRIEYDGNKPAQDKYGRELVYVYLQDGSSINRAMITSGHAYEYTYKKENYKYQTEFKQSQEQAIKEKIGLWAENTCNGKK